VTNVTKVTVRREASRQSERRFDSADTLGLPFQTVTIITNVTVSEEPGEIRYCSRLRSSRLSTRVAGNPQRQMKPASYCLFKRRSLSVNAAPALAGSAAFLLDKAALL
jgi:hypothetical protein